MSTEYIEVKDKLNPEKGGITLSEGTAGLKIEAKHEDRFVKIWLSEDDAWELGDWLVTLSRRKS